MNPVHQIMLEHGCDHDEAWALNAVREAAQRIDPKCPLLQSIVELLNKDD